ncbi:DUF4476 domain-containing protein [uncultured Bacteroides sp.]|uniref:DUF4476 domain-containing protein n=1 Tax=uncultured Bacteroides sp. TaxID=162156 RepID=UPI002AAB31DF|nr:DUF4476 domain-containing protein [uncultured Bacteroides sp.]
MKTLGHLFALLILVVSVSSCAALLGTSNDFLMNIHHGMSREQVLSMLGNPNYRRFDHEMEEWGYEKSIAANPGMTVINISFIDGKVVGMDSFHKHQAVAVPVSPQTDVLMPHPYSSYRPRRLDVMSDRDFQALYNKVKNKPFKDDQLEILSVGVDKRSVTCDQCVRMMSIFTFDDDRLEVLKRMSPNIFDLEHADRIVDSLSFISSEDKARSILGIRR